MNEKEKTQEELFNERLEEHKRRMAQNILERRKRAKELGEEEDTPYMDEMEWTVGMINKLESSVFSIIERTKEIKNTLQNIQTSQLQTLQAVLDIWTFLIQSQVEIDEYFMYKRNECSRNLQNLFEKINSVKDE